MLWIFCENAYECRALYILPMQNLMLMFSCRIDFIRQCTHKHTSARQIRMVGAITHFQRKQTECK